MQTKTLIAITFLVLLTSLIVGIPVFVFTGHNEPAGILGLMGFLGLVMLLAAHSDS